MDVGRLAHLEEGVDGPQVLGVGVAQREEAGGRPDLEGGGVVEHVALLGAVEVLGPRDDVTVGLPHPDAHHAALELGGPLLGGVRRGRAGHRAVLVGREPVGRRDGVAPGHLLVPPDVDHRRADQAGARDVVGAGDGELHLGEPVTAAPREVRVAQDHAATRGRGSRPDGGGVRAEGAVGVLAEAGLEVVGRGHVGGGEGETVGAELRNRGTGRGRGGLDDLRHEDPGRGEQVGRVDAVPDVERGDVRADVAGATAGGVGDAAPTADVADVGVDAGDVAAHHRAGLSARPAPRVGQQLLDHPTVVDVGEQRVGLEVRRVERHPVVVAPVRAEPARPLAAPGDEGVGEVAQVRLGRRVAVPVAQRAPVVGDHVGDAVLGARDGGLEARRRPGGHATGCVGGCVTGCVTGRRTGHRRRGGLAGGGHEGERQRRRECCRRAERRASQVHEVAPSLGTPGARWRGREGCAWVVAGRALTT